MLNWTELFETEPLPPHMQGMKFPKECRTPKCQLCGRFTKSLRLVWTGFPPEPDYAVGQCCDPQLKEVRSSP